MPIYEYRCSNGHSFDVLQRMSEDALSDCTVCGATVQRVFHAPAVHFKGSGFYNTDYGTKSKNADDAKKKKKKEEGKSKSDSDSSSKGKTDSSSSSDGAKKPKASTDSKSAS